MTPKVKAMLDQIDEFLAPADADSKELWGVLTALRGPDFLPSPSHRIKQSTTAVIRSAALPKTARASADRNNGSPDQATCWSPILALFIHPDNPVTSVNLVDAATVSYHFKDHIKRAARVLGLSEGT